MVELSISSRQTFCWCLGADNPFHISQLHIILDRTDALLLSLDYEMGAYDPESSECVLPSFTLSLWPGDLTVNYSRYPTTMRLFAHSCLYLQLIDVARLVVDSMPCKTTMTRTHADDASSSTPRHPCSLGRRRHACTQRRVELGTKCDK